MTEQPNMTIAVATSKVRMGLAAAVGIDVDACVTVRATKAGTPFYTVHLPKTLDAFQRLRAIRYLKDQGMDWR